MSTPKASARAANLTQSAPYLDSVDSYAGPRAPIFVSGEGCSVGAGKGCPALLARASLLQFADAAASVAVSYAATIRTLW